MKLDRVNVLGVGISAINMDLAARVIIDAVHRRQKGYVCATGVHGVMEAFDDPTVKAALNGALLCAPDGMPMVWLGRLAGRKEIRRVYGPDLMLRMCEVSCHEGFRHFFYGGANGAAAELSRKLSARFPGLQVVGTYEPPFRPLNQSEERELAQRVRASRPDLFWIG